MRLILSFEHVQFFWNLHYMPSRLRVMLRLVLQPVFQLSPRSAGVDQWSLSPDISSQILSGGTCLSSKCAGSSSVVSGLGICLSDLVEVPTASGTGSEPPLPSITGIDTPVSSPASPSTTTTGRPLAWWEILLMALGCAFIFVVILMLWRRHARKKRAKATVMFATAKRLHRKGGWRNRLVRFGEKLFGHKRSYPVDPREQERIQMEKLRSSEEARYNRDMDKFIDAYDYSRAGSSRGPSPIPSLYERERERERAHDRLVNQRTGNNLHHRRLSGASLTNGSLYSQVTGMPKRAPEPRQPVRNARDLLPSRFSATSYATSSNHSGAQETLPPPPDLLEASRPPTPAQEYARTVKLGSQQPEPRGTYWLQPTNTGNSNNPFLR
ncbi:hypothetical protein PHLCEN_2v10832 [Hermanssonia centrifuga]|uniref:Uncharacterized protein n=1 Tax=Hermanssonia centrifuga TaxID=98765 RepID=A0A2R6NLR6_9APHY|nr:hypothetical protein PHLCEN_2v10832 [Hermanssonia centrifuga]